MTDVVFNINDLIKPNIIHRIRNLGTREELEDLISNCHRNLHFQTFHIIRAVHSGYSLAGIAINLGITRSRASQLAHKGYRALCNVKDVNQRDPLFFTLSTRTINCLWRKNLRTTPQVLDYMSKYGLRSIRGLGEKSRKEVLARLLELGYCCKED